MEENEMLSKKQNLCPKQRVKPKHCPLLKISSQSITLSGMSISNFEMNTLRIEILTPSANRALEYRAK